MALGQIYKLVVVSEQAGVAISNAFYYKERVSPTTPNDLDVWEAWKATINTAWQSITTDLMSITCQIAKVVDPGDGPSFTKFDLEGGSVAGDSLPTNSQIPFSSYGFTIEPPNRLARNGILKGGIPMSNVVDGELTNTAVALHDFVRDTLKGAIISPDGGEYDPFLRYLAFTVPKFVPILSYKFRNIIRVATRRTSNLCQTG